MSLRQSLLKRRQKLAAKKKKRFLSKDFGVGGSSVGVLARKISHDKIAHKLYPK